MELMACIELYALGPGSMFTLGCHDAPLSAETSTVMFARPEADHGVENARRPLPGRATVDPCEVHPGARAEPR